MLSYIAQATAVLKHLWSAGEVHLHVRAQLTSLTLHCALMVPPILITFTPCPVLRLSSPALDPQMLCVHAESSTLMVADASPCLLAS